MRIISRGNSEEPMRITCDSCGSELEYVRDDILSGTHFQYVECPVCGKDIFLDEDEDEDDGLRRGYVPVYPKKDDFYSFEDGVPIEDERINEWIKGACEQFDETPMSELKNGFLYSVGTGDTIMIARGCDDPDEPLTIWVCRGYSEGEYWSDRFHK